MMRSLYSGVAGLKTHQTKMDVIGNNIANVNTVAFKSTSVNFNEIYYQTTQGASGPNTTTGQGGVNAKQIGLGVAMASTMVNIKQAGATQTTGGAFDIKINGDSFFIVNDGSKNLFTRAGSFYVDAAGNLAMTSTGYNVMGWQVDKESGLIKKDTVSALRIMSAENMTSAPEATQKAVAAGVLDANAKATKTDDGYIMNLNFYDALGYQYTAKFKVQDSKSGDKGVYRVSLTDVLDSNSRSVITGAHTAGELFGAADSDSADTGSLIAGRTFVNPVKASGTVTEDEAIKQTFQNFFRAYYNDTKDYATPTTIKAYDASGNVLTDEKAKTIMPYFIQNQSTKQMIENAYYFADEDNKLYKAVFKKDDTGAVTEITYVSLGCSKIPDDLKDKITENEIAIDKKRIHDMLQDNFSGIDANIYIDGESKLTDESKYYDEITLTDGTKFTSIYPCRLERTGTTEPYQYRVFTGSSYVPAEGTSGEKNYTTLDALSNELKSTSLFKSNAKSLDAITTSLENYKNGTNAVKEYSADKNDVYEIGLKGTSYYSELKFNEGDGTFISIGNADAAVLGMSTLNTEGISGPFENISIDFTQTTNYNNGGSSTLGLDKGDKDGKDAGKKLGAMTGISIDKNGMVFGSYDNGNTVLLAQIAVANFANASGLEKVGENCYETTLNSGEFDGIGVEIGANGGSMTTGALEMSNVDLSNEFTDMITTQRGFQANSRIITTSDTLLEELINLKR
jgi:flagellar hook protein FlgE